MAAFVGGGGGSPSCGWTSSFPVGNGGSSVTCFPCYLAWESLNSHPVPAELDFLPGRQVAYCRADL